MDFTKLVSLLQHGGIYFPTIAELHDPFEGSFARGNQLLRPLVYRHLVARPQLSAGELVKQYRDRVAASCWHMNEQESAGMWKLYAKSNEAVCIQSTFRKLRDGFGGDVRVGTVRYVDYETEWIPESNPLAPFLYKRKSFEFEREVRAIIPLGNSTSVSALNDDSNLQKTKGYWHGLNLRTFIERIFIAPDAPDWFADLVRDVTTRYGYGDTSVVKSSLATSPLY